MPSNDIIKPSAMKRELESDVTSTATPSSGSRTEGDHRKKKRNRTTQSCLNCHSSKRMCDRKRPACARCTQLGLTGLCIYEVDDPNQRVDPQGETARLIARVAELETVIRQMKNKPHPRWLQPEKHLGDGAPNRWSQQRLNERPVRPPNGSSNRSSSPSSPPTSDDQHDQGSLIRSQLLYPQPGSLVKGTNAHPAPERQHDVHPPHRRSPQSNAPSSLLPNPGQYSRPVASGIPHDYNVATMLLPYPSHCAEYGAMVRGGMPGHVQQGPCCAQDPLTYSALLDLSAPLQRAVDVMSKNPAHQAGRSPCHLHRQVLDLDRQLSSAVSAATASFAPGNAHQPYANSAYRPDGPHAAVSNSSSIPHGGQTWVLPHHSSSSDPQDDPEMYAVEWGSRTR